jgi:hypothetical protein
MKRLIDIPFQVVIDELNALPVPQPLTVITCLKYVMFMQAINVELEMHDNLASAIPLQRIFDLAVEQAGMNILDTEEKVLYFRLTFMTANMLA